MKEILEGSPNTFNKKNKTVNFIASHDGFSLIDLNSYTFKSASTQGGSDWEICGDYGNDWQKRENAIRKQLAFLFLSYGIPMIQIGDIIMHTKNGNNNSYNKDNGINYLNWDKALISNSFENRIMEYTRNLIKFRNENSVFRKNNFREYLTYHYDNGQIAELNNQGYWHNGYEKFFGCLINSETKRIYIACNKSGDSLKTILPKNIEEKRWHVCSDSSIFNYLDFNPKSHIESEYILNPQAMAVFMEL